MKLHSLTEHRDCDNENCIDEQNYVFVQCANGAINYTKILLRYNIAMQINLYFFMNVYKLRSLNM